MDEEDKYFQLVRDIEWRIAVESIFSTCILIWLYHFGYHTAFWVLLGFCVLGCIISGYRMKKYSVLAGLEDY